MKRLKREIKGITLVVLVITIIVLLLLAGIAINLIIGKEGIIARTQTAREEYINSSKRELADLEELYSTIQIATNGDSTLTIDMETLNQYINGIVDEKLKESQNSSAQMQTKIEELVQKNKELETKINNISDKELTYKELASAKSTNLTTVPINGDLLNYKYVVVVRTSGDGGTAYYSGLIPVETFKDGYRYAVASGTTAYICQYKNATTCAIQCSDSVSTVYLYGVK